MLVWLVDAGSVSLIIAFIFVSAGFVVLRRNEPDMERPFRIPGGVGTGVVAIVLAAALGAQFLPGLAAALIWPYECVILRRLGVGGRLLDHPDPACRSGSGLSTTRWFALLPGVVCRKTSGRPPRVASVWAVSRVGPGGREFPAPAHRRRHPTGSSNHRNRSNSSLTPSAAAPSPATRQTSLAAETILSASTR